MIRFIIKSVFWLSLAFIVMPKILSNDADQARHSSAAIKLPPQEKIDDIIAAGQTAAEVGGFCFKNPDLCSQGQQILSATGSGILDGSGKVLEFLSNQFGTGEVKEISTQTENSKFKNQSANQTVPLPHSRPQ
ncbi:DUF5330 domain-containing protein [Brucellaceae bacterium C25G]